MQRNNFALLSFTDQSVDMLDWFSKMTLEVILATAFGVDAKIQMGENSEILQEAKKLFHVPFFLRQMAVGVFIPCGVFDFGSPVYYFFKLVIGLFLGGDT